MIKRINVLISFIFIIAIASSQTLKTKQTRVNYIETHVHLQATYKEHGKLKQDWIGTAEYTIQEMNKLGISKCLIMPPPQGPENKNPYDYKILLPVIKKYPDKFALAAGGGTLNLIIQKSIKKGKVTEPLKTEFRKKAQEIIDAGAVAFGEMTALHLSFNPSHPFETAPPNHKLFLELADISAKNKLPIDLHMEAVTKDLVIPSWFKTPPNPQELKENISAFEDLLAHNRNAKGMKRVMRDNQNKYLDRLKPAQIKRIEEITYAGMALKGYAPDLCKKRKKHIQFRINVS